MSNKKLSLPENIAIDYFKSDLLNNFGDYLDKKTSGLLASLLAMDYALRLQETISIEDHLIEVKQRLNQYLKDKENNKDKEGSKDKKFKYDDFACIISLFTIAISDQNNTDQTEDELSIADKEIIESIIKLKFPNATAELIIIIKKLLKKIMQQQKKSNLLKFVINNSELFYSITKSIHKRQQKELTNQVLAELEKLLKQKNKLISKNSQKLKLASKPSSKEFSGGFSKGFSKGSKSKMSDLLKHKHKAKNSSNISITK